MDSKVIRAHGDEQYWKAVDVLAEMQNVSLGELVKNAIDRVHGKQLRKLNAFAATAVANKLQSNHEEAEPDHA